MALNRYDVPAQQATGQEYYKLPINEMLGVLAMKQKKQDDNLKEAQQFGDYTLKLNSLEADRLKHQEINKNVNQMVNDLTSGQYDLTSSDGRNKLNSLRNYVKTEFSPNGKAYAIQSNFDKYQGWIKRQQENKELNKDYFNKANQAFLSKYQGIGDLDPTTGTYNSFNAPDLVNTPDVTKYFDTYGDKIESEIQQKAYASPDGKGYIYEGTYYTDKRSPELIAKVLSKYAQNDPSLQSYLEQGSQIGIFDPNAVSQGLVGTQKVKDKRGNEYDKLVLNGNHPFSGALSAAVDKYTKNVYKEEKGIKADSEFGRKREEELKYPDLTGWSQGLEGKPTVSGRDPEENKTLITNHNLKLQSLNKSFKETLGYNLQEEDLKQLNAGNYNYFKGLSDNDLASRGLDRGIINKFVNEGNAILESKNIAETKEIESENYAKNKLGTEYNKLKSKYDDLPDLGGYGKDEILQALTLRNKEGKIDQYHSTPILAELIRTGSYQQYIDYVKDKTNDKFIKAKQSYYNLPGKKQSTHDIEYSWNIGGYEKKDLNTMRAAAENYFATPATWAHHVVLSNDLDINGKPFNEYLQAQGVDLTDPKQFNIDPKGVSLSKNVLDPSIESQNKLAFRVPVMVKGSNKELWITTDQVSSPEIQKITNSPSATAYRTYSSIRREGVDNYKPMKYSNYNVEFNYTDKYRPIKIDGIKYDEETGLRKLAALEAAQQLNLSREDALKALKDIQ